MKSFVIGRNQYLVIKSYRDMCFNEQMMLLKNPRFSHIYLTSFYNLSFLGINYPNLVVNLDLPDDQYHSDSDCNDGHRVLALEDGALLQ